MYAYKLLANRIDHEIHVFKREGSQEDISGAGNNYGGLY